MSCAVERDAAAAGGPGGDLGEPVQRAQQRRLARAGGADQREHLALAHRQGDVAHDPVLAVGEPHRLGPHALAHVRGRRASRARLRGGGRRLRRAGRRRRRAAGRRDARLAVDRDPPHGRWHQRVHRESELPEPTPSARAAAGARGRARRPAVSRVTSRVQHEHDREQHERGGVGLLRGVALAGGRVVIHVAGQRRAGAAQQCRAAVLPLPVRSCSERAEQDRDDRRVADDAAHAEHRCRWRCSAGSTAAARGGSWSRASCRARRRPRASRSGSCESASRVGPTTSGSASSDMTMPGGEERLARDGAAGGVLGEEAEEAPREDRAGRRSRARCSARRRSSRSPTRSRARATTGARTPTATPRAPMPERRGDSDADRGHDQRALDRVEEAAASGSGAARRRGEVHEQARAQVGDALDEHEQDDRDARSRTARCRRAQQSQ